MGLISKENCRYALTINRNLKKQLEELAKANNRSLNNYIINILSEHLKKN